jgi:hypothetical protein
MSDNLPKMSVPSIPSRFLTPTMDMAPKQQVDRNERIQSIDGYTMSRLVNDPAKVGPQSYFPVYEQTARIPVVSFFSLSDSYIRAQLTGITVAPNVLVFQIHK